MLARVLFFGIAVYMAFDLHIHAEKYHMKWFGNPILLAGVLVVFLFMLLLRHKKHIY